MVSIIIDSTAQTYCVMIQSTIHMVGVTQVDKEINKIDIVI